MRSSIGLALVMSGYPWTSRICDQSVSDTLRPPGAKNRAASLNGVDDSARPWAIATVDETSNKTQAAAMAR